jgi:pimeloyl-ACP methyl ester carboxylesterase
MKSEGVIGEPAIVLGYSMGGTVAVHLAAQTVYG